MQQLTIEHKKITTIDQKQQVVENTKAKEKDRRPGKGRCIALSRRVCRLQNTDTFYVESESSDNTYYFVKYNPSVFEWCSCKDFESNRAKICKHLYAIEFAIRFGTLKDIDKLPAEAKRYNGGITATTVSNSSYEEDEYDY